MTVCEDGAVVTAEHILDDRFCSFIVDLLLRGRRVEYFVIIVEFSLDDRERRFDD